MSVSTCLRRTVAPRSQKSELHTTVQLSPAHKACLSRLLRATEFSQRPPEVQPALARAFRQSQATTGLRPTFGDAFRREKKGAVSFRARL